MKTFEMNLLNSEELAEIQGGKSRPSSTSSIGVCDKKGDVIVCGIMGNIKACLSFEVGCAPAFTSTCKSLSFTITGCNYVTFK